MIDWIPFQVQPWYPHMSPADTAIWSRFIAAHRDAFDAVAYDVPVGEGAEFDVTAGGVLGEGIKKLYQRKIDVLARKGDKRYVIELKPRASTAALGQVKSYVRLAERDIPELRGAAPMIITDALVPEMEFLAKEEGVELRVV